mmetsp:Transcript_101250/g.315555  ORF Transcript_101250/g.315555 Transcript_101250/m.315555 type:complete len:165 (+) Transcript_101250:87-581(+)|eukprot:CAMPEP_0204535654 /NCGR_PEP_ID=MMETSP0661-20131031/13871_1 /ASSEMBLY_ACC=CAM_ASM_000606 /TAXON_ID=109239 /ORGANISM="Alexandrium margalefi, Strain AMGDE01CS-322" /LENGTH=164 /DNA_ID=CAMNT_0051542149 /DNA_START=83 /DNA_END=577 /DNA_ORIENTATION=+
MTDDADNFYEVLGVSRDASVDAIRKAYYKGALRWHPDKNADNRGRAEEMFKRLARAYKVLSDPSLRSVYDGAGVEGLGEDWWPKDASSMDMAWQFFIHRLPGRSPTTGFSEAKLREIFPEMFGRRAGEGEAPGRPVAAEGGAGGPGGPGDARVASRRAPTGSRL